MKEGSVWFVLSLSWYQQWKEYVKFFEKITLKLETSEIIENSAPEIEELMDEGPPDFPGPISNAELLDYEAMNNPRKCPETAGDYTSLILRQDLRETEDF